MEIFPLLAKEKPQLVFLDLDVEDLNDFVMHDLLKKTGVTLSIPLLVTYNNDSEKFLGQYEKLQYKAEGYHKKPLDDNQVSQLLDKYVLVGPEAVAEAVPEIDDFSEIDRLVKGELLDDEPTLPVNHKKDEREATNPFSSIDSQTKDIDMDDGNLDLGLGLDNVLESDMGLDDGISDSLLGDLGDPSEAEEIPSGRAERELEVQLISLERQNEFLRAESKEFSKQIETLKNERDSARSQVGDLREELGRISVDMDQEHARSGEVTDELEQLKNRLIDQVALLEKDKENLQEQLRQQQERTLQADDAVMTTAQRVSELDILLVEKNNELDGLRNRLDDLGNQFQKIQEECDLAKQQVTELSNQLTDKERELVAQNHEFEKNLQLKSDQLLQHTEERLLSEFKQKEAQYKTQLATLNADAHHKEDALTAQLAASTEKNNLLQAQAEEHKKKEDSLSRAISALAEEKTALTEQVTAQEQTLNNIRRQLEQEESNHKNSLDQMARELEENRSRMIFYKNKVDSLSELFQQGLSVSRDHS